MEKDLSWLKFPPAAHRGLHDNIVAPENSMLAFKNAVDKGYSIEFDVHLTKSNVLVVHHDYSMIRTGSRNIKIKNLDTNNLEQYKLFNTNESIPTLDSVLNLIDGKVGLIIEIKPTRHFKKVCDALMQRLEKYNGKYCIESFDINVVNYMYKNYPDVILGQLYSSNFMHRLQTTILKQYKKVDFLALSKALLNKKQYKTIRNNNKDKIFIAWTIRTNNELDTAIKTCDNYIFETSIKNDSYINPPNITK